VITGTSDEILSVDHIKNLYERIPSKVNKELVIIENADHNFSKKEHFDTMKEYIVNFFREFLRPIKAG
jgi:fermentation-respiration switch protein FrsA (DUF1100 family)